MFDVSAGAKKVVFGRSGCFWLLRFHCPTDFCRINVLTIDAAYLLARSLDGFDQVGDGDGGQQADDGYHDHDFDEGETALSFSLHSSVLVGG